MSMGKAAQKTAETPRHKPSRKIALEEVLISLQDLVNNEFSDNDTEATAATEHEPNAGDQPNVLHASGAIPSVTGRKRGRPRKHKPVETGSQAPTDPIDYSYSQEQKDLFGHKPDPSSAEAKSTDSTRKQNTAAGKINRPATKLETDQIPTSLKIVQKENREPETTLPSKKADKQAIEPRSMAQKSANTAESLPEQSSLNWADDIPVLTDVVDLDEFDTEQLQDVVDQSLASKNLTPEARQIAVKVAAKLNIEMRESGGEQLDIKTIMRLQSLLKEALEPKD